MFRIKRKLSEMSRRGERILISLMGCGKMGKGLVSQLSHIDGISPSVIIDHTPEKARQALLSTGVPEDRIRVTDDLEEGGHWLRRNSFVVSRNEALAYSLPVNAVVEATGVAETGARIALKAIEHEKHIIMLNVEADCAVGPILYKKAKEAGVIYTGTKGDEPGAIVDLVDFALGAGFQVVAVGKGKNNALDHEVTDQDLAQEAKERGLSPRMLTTFVDGSNTMAELCIVCNALGFIPDVPGCHGLDTDPDHITDLLKREDQGGILKQEGVVEYAFGMAPGVFVIVTNKNEEVVHLMEYLGMGKGPNYLLYRPYHLTSLETPITIFDTVIEGESSLAPHKGQCADVIAVAKRDIKEGESLKGIGRDTVYGILVEHKLQAAEGLLPLTLIDGESYAVRDIPKGAWLGYRDVALNPDSTIVALRKEQDAIM